MATIKTDILKDNKKLSLIQNVVLQGQRFAKQGKTTNPHKGNALLNQAFCIGFYGLTMKKSLNSK